MNIPRLFAVLLALMLSLAVAHAADRTVNVKFPKGASGTTLSGTIKGYDSIIYRVGVAAGQRMSVQLDTSNASNYFNITAPGASEALFVGSTSGNSTTFVIPSSGNYEINVYLMRNAARRSETAKFELTIYVEGKGAVVQPKPSGAKPVPANPTPVAVDTSLMPRYCAGEVSAKFGVRPQDITTNLAFKSGNRYVTQGNFEGANGATFFNCWFGLDGRFQSIN